MFSIMLKPKVLLTITVAIAIVGSAWLLSRGIRYFRHGDPIITVTGKAERNIKSDLTYWKISLTTKENERLKAYEVLQESHNKVISFLKEKGITENEITVSNSSVKHYDGYNDEGNNEGGTGIVKRREGEEIYENVLYTSPDYGLRWFKTGENQVLPEEFVDRTKTTIITDDKNFIWIFGGVSGTQQISEVWRGRLNKLIVN